MADDASQVKRTPEIEDPTNRYVIHPLSRAAVTYFARWGLSPNVVSLLGLGLGAGAAAAYYHYRYAAMVLLGFLLMAGWHVMDGADGQLARLTGRSSQLGKVLDGLCDHGTFALVYVALALATAPARGGWVWAVAALAGLSHLVQASAYEFQRHAYDFWGHAKSAARPDRPDAFHQSLQQREGPVRLFERIYLLYLRLQYRVAAVDEALQRDLAAALRHADDAARLRDGYRSAYCDSVRRWALLSANYRTLAIFAACLAGAPLLFFGFELVVLNGVFFLLVRLKRRRNRAFRNWLSEQKSASSEPLPTGPPSP